MSFGSISTRALVIAVICMAAAGFSACNKSLSASSSVPASPAPAAVSSAPASSAPSSVSSEAASSVKETVLTATIDDATMNTLTVKTPDGKAVTFSTMDADKSGAKGLIIGTEVTLTYTGELNGDDASDVQVVKVEQDESAAPPAEPEENTITGSVVDAGTNTVNIMTDDGKSLVFSTEDADKSGIDGLSTGKRITIAYTGEIVDVDTSGVIVLRLEDVK